MGSKGIIIFLQLCFLSSFASSKFDSNYVHVYNNKLVIAFYQSANSYDLLFKQNITPDSLGKSTFNYISQAGKTSGFSLDYDKVSFSVGWKTPLTDSSIYKRGKTTYSNYMFAFSGEKFRVETSYRKYRGFYDQSTPIYDSTFELNSPYFQNPTLSTQSIKVKGFYFVNKKHRFSYSSSYSNTSRQVKTAGSFILFSNVFNLRMNSSESLIPPLINNYYGSWKNYNYFNMTGISVGPGYTFNLVFWKRFFINLTATVGIEARYLKYGIRETETSYHKFNVMIAAKDLRAAIGFNAKNFFLSFTNIFDYDNYNFKSVNFRVQYLSGSFNLGYRFPLKEYKPIKMMKENKYYKML